MFFSWSQKGLIHLYDAICKKHREAGGGGGGKGTRCPLLASFPRGGDAGSVPGGGPHWVVKCVCAHVCVLPNSLLTFFFVLHSLCLSVPVTSSDCPVSGHLSICVHGPCSHLGAALHVHFHPFIHKTHSEGDGPGVCVCGSTCPFPWLRSSTCPG